MLEVIILILSVILNLLLGLFVYIKNPKSTTHRLFFAMTAGFVGFTVVNFFSLYPVVFSQLTWIRLDLLCGALISLFAYLTFDVFPGAKFNTKSAFRRFVVFYSLLVAALTQSPLVFSRLDVSGGSPQPVPGPAIPLFALQQLGLLLLAFTLLLRKAKKSRGIEKEQYKYIITGLVVALSFIILFNLILVQVFKVTVFVPFSPIGIVLFTGAFSYAIVRHRLLDIRAVVARSVAYVLLLLVLALVYSLSIIVATSLLQLRISDPVQQVFFIVISVVLAFSFQPLRRMFERLTNRVFYQDKYNPERLVGKIAYIASQVIQLEELTHRVLAEICEEMKLASGTFLIMNEGKIYQQISYGHTSKKITPYEAHDLSAAHKILIFDEIDEGHLKELMRESAASVVLSLKTKEDEVGLLVLGEKLSGNVYSSEDIETLSILAPQLAVAIENAKAYAQLQQSEIRLKHEVEKATRDLRQANTHLQELDAAKDDFISMASHQLRTPLTTIKGYLSMVLEGDAGKVAIKQKEYLKQSFDGSERMVTLINDLLNVSRMDAGRFFLEVTEVDIKELVNTQVEVLSPHAEAKRIKLIYHKSAKKLPLILCDKNKTREVISNFIDNAIYYTKEGQVDVYLDATGPNVVFKVVDTGIGVPEAVKSKLFVKFYRAPNAMKTRPDGTGLGLYLAKKVINDQGGELIFESKENAGSTFGFKLPVESKLKPGVIKK